MASAPRLALAGSEEGEACVKLVLIQADQSEGGLCSAAVGRRIEVSQYCNYTFSEFPIADCRVCCKSNRESADLLSLQHFEHASARYLDKKPYPAAVILRLNSES